QEGGERDVFDLRLGLADRDLAQPPLGQIRPPGPPPPPLLLGGGGRLGVGRISPTRRRSTRSGPNSGTGTALAGRAGRTTSLSVWPAIFSWSFSRPYSSASGLGGHPGT